MTEADIAQLWAARASLAPDDEDARRAVTAVIDQLDAGDVRVAQVVDGEVVVHEWVRQAILLAFKLLPMVDIEVGPYRYRDRVPLKSTLDGVRAVPGAIARWGSYLAPGVVQMPSYVNIGAYVDEGTMVDTWATVGSCAQIGKRVHLSGGVGIGGVLEPAQAAPVVVEDDVMIGSRSMITQGARVGRGSVLGEGVLLNPTIPVIDAQTGQEIGRGVVPPWSVGVQASRRRAFPGGEFGLPCVLVLRRLTEGERHDKARLNDVLREHGVAT